MNKITEKSMQQNKAQMEKFQLGQLCLTRGVTGKLGSSAEFTEFVSKSLNRYCACDWGEMCEDDKKMNDEAVVSGDDRIFAAYNNAEHPDWKIWIITEWDRSVTTILFPREY